MTPGNHPELSAEEQAILRLLSQGSRTSEIAKRLQLDYKTVAETCKNIKLKLQVETIAEVVAWAEKNRLSE